MKLMREKLFRKKKLVERIEPFGFLTFILHRPIEVCLEQERNKFNGRYVEDEIC